MHVILVTEIWGCTPHVESLAESLQPLVESVTIVDPFDGTDPEFTAEDEAYSAFLEQCGHEAYVRRLHEALHGITGPVVLVGFSAGAAAVWDVISAGSIEAISHAVCFYGSGIRHMVDRVPGVPVELVFPEREAHFDVGEVVAALNGRPKVSCHTVPEGHGFMNPLSVNYDEVAAERWREWLEGKLV